jgi:hypothetical protein
MAVVADAGLRDEHGSTGYESRFQTIVERAGKPKAVDCRLIQLAPFIVLMSRETDVDPTGLTVRSPDQRDHMRSRVVVVDLGNAPTDLDAVSKHHHALIGFRNDHRQRSLDHPLRSPTELPIAKGGGYDGSTAGIERSE